MMNFTLTLDLSPAAAAVLQAIGDGLVRIHEAQADIGAKLAELTEEVAAQRIDADGRLRDLKRMLKLRDQDLPAGGKATDALSTPSEQRGNSAPLPPPTLQPPTPPVAAIETRREPVTPVPEAIGTLDVSSPTAPAGRVPNEPASRPAALSEADKKRIAGRRSVLEEFYGTDMPMEEIQRRCAEAYGSVTPAATLHALANKLGLHRPARTRATPAPVAAKAAPEPARVPDKPLPVKWSDSRKDLIRRLYADNAASVVAIECNKLPGPPVSAPEVNAIAVTLGVSKPAPPATNEPIDADFETIRAWAGVRGIEFRSVDDIGRVNRKCLELGVRQFRFAPGVRRVLA